MPLKRNLVHIKTHISSKNPWEVGRKCSWWFEYMNDQTTEVIKKNTLYNKTYVSILESNFWAVFDFLTIHYASSKSFWFRGLYSSILRDVFFTQIMIYRVELKQITISSSGLNDLKNQPLTCLTLKTCISQPQSKMGPWTQRPCSRLSKFRKKIAKLRCSNHSVHIEQGRHEKNSLGKLTMWAMPLYFFQSIWIKVWPQKHLWCKKYGERIWYPQCRPGSR